MHASRCASLLSVAGSAPALTGLTGAAASWPDALIRDAGPHGRP
ncbi:MAG TPA: hypothetical protein VD836_18290 [Solirubrobacteraceae bacterium]|nr:hypothetical protein [Solirubrobacteraceae bacterium]